MPDDAIGFVRRLTVSVPGEPGREILLAKPGPPAHDDATADQVSEIVTKGAGPRIIFTTRDCRQT